MTPLDTALAAGLAAAVASLVVVVGVIVWRAHRGGLRTAPTTRVDVETPPPLPLRAKAKQPSFLAATTPTDPPFLLAGTPPPDEPPSAIAAQAARTQSLDVGDVVALAASLSCSLDAAAGAASSAPPPPAALTASARTVSGASSLTSDDDGAGVLPPPLPPSLRPLLGGPGPPAALDDVILHGRLGAGASGAVFRGAWRGAPVAVKLTRVRAADPASLDAAVREVVVGRAVAHPHVVATYAWSVVAGAAACEDRAAAASPDLAAARAALARTSEAGAALQPPLPATPPSPRPPSAASFKSDEGFGSPHAAPRAASAGGRGLATPTAPAGSSGAPPSSRGRGPLLAALADGRVGPLPLVAGDAVVVAVLELCDLGTLRRALDRAAFAPSSRHGARAAYRALLRTAQEVARGVDALHAARFVHGDVSPSNVLLRAHRADRRGFVAKVADFGHAMPLSASGNGARVGARVGAPAYAAPEKLAAGVAGPPSDVYALGVLLCEMWNGSPPYAGLRLHSAEVAARVAGGELRPAWTRPAAPPPLVALAEACWDADPEVRPTAAQVAARLADIEAAFRREKR